MTHMATQKQANNGNGAHPVIAHRKQRTAGERASDALTRFLGSWKFIILFFSYLIFWICTNLYAIHFSWDPFPFILLNLTLSCIAAFQAPIILMSQNRQTDRDRIAAAYDYAVNRKAEREIQNMQKDLEEIKAMLRELQPKKKTSTRS